ncbi:MAG: hypothetical protein D6702_01295 [Planctomycetota bacterium]|nr:MAG: hypothetical protein D6702_01295 [Planctomycetota bacterium]
MVGLLGFLALVIGSWQGPELPPLPQELAGNEAAHAALRALGAAGTEAERLEAAQTLLQAMAGADPAVQAGYLMACDGAGVFPPSFDLAAAWRSLAAGWSGAPQTILEVLRQKENADRGPLLGAIRAAAILEPGDPEIVQALGPQLDQLDAGPDARRALARITGFWFANWAEFEAWWGSARHLQRNDWLRQALDSGEQRQIALWRSLLEDNPERALEAVASGLPAVVRLGLETMGGLDPATAGAAEALRDLYGRTRDPLLQAMAIQLVPRFLRGREAGAMLDLALVSPAPQVQLAAVRALAEVQPPEEARAGILRALGQAYGSPEGPKGPWSFRHEILVALDKVFGNGNAGDLGPQEEALTAHLLTALDRERNEKVRTALYSLLGSLRRPTYFDMLLPIAADEDRDLADRSSALDALTQIGVAHGRTADLLALLHPLLGHREPDLRYRVLQCLKRVKDPSSLPMLNARLAQEGDPSLRSELLRTYRAFGEVKTPEELDPLLNYQPHPDDYTIHRDSLRDQIGTTDLTKLDHALEVLEARGSWRLAKELLEGFPRDGLPPEEAARLERELTIIRAEWLLTGPLENGRVKQAEAMAGRLGALAAAEPGECRWGILLGRLQARRGLPLEAFSAWRAALLQEGFPAERRWPVTLDAVRALAGLGPAAAPHAGEALDLLARAGDPPEGLAAEVGRLRAQLEALLPPEAAPPASVEEPAAEPPAEESGGQEGAGGDPGAAGAGGSGSGGGSCG